MLTSLGYNDLLSHQRTKYSNIVFTDVPSLALLNKFTLALNANGHLHYKVHVEQLSRVPYIQIAHTHWGDVIAGSTIKHRDGDVAEIGYMLVGKEYRGQGIAEYMTNSRICYAQKAGIKILYARVRGNNVNSIANLRKAGFQPADRFLSRKQKLSTVRWFYYPLQQISLDHCRKLLRKKLIDLIPAMN